MGARGRKSGAELSVIGGGPLAVLDRPSPPVEFTPAQADEWRAVVNRLPSGWFPRETWGILAEYCRMRESADCLARLISSVEASFGATGEMDIDAYDKLIRRRESVARTLGFLATKMRLTQQSTYDPEKSKGRQRGGTAPWDYDLPAGGQTAGGA